MHLADTEQPTGTTFWASATLSSTSWPMPRTRWSRSSGSSRGAMTLIDEERSAFLYRRLGPAREVSGGSCANTIAAVASLGGRAAYIGRVRDDQLGGVFSHDIRAAGVTFRNPPSPTGPPPPPA